MAYGTDQGFQDWLTANGYALPVGAPSPAVLRLRGSTYLDATYEPLWTGTRADYDQDLGWPRHGAVIDCSLPIPNNVVPKAVVNAAYRAAYLEGTTSGILNGTAVRVGERVKRKKVDVIEKEFFDDGTASAGSGGGAFIDPAIDGAMRSFICATSDTSAFIYSVG